MIADRGFYLVIAQSGRRVFLGVRLFLNASRNNFSVSNVIKVLS